MKCRDCEKWGWGDDEGTPVWGWCWKYTSCPDPDIDRSCPDFSPKKPDIFTTLSTLQAKSKKLRAELENYRKGHREEAISALSPPNEPLTLEELREMNKPVWVACKPIEGGDGDWCLCKHGCIVTPSGNSYDVGEIPHWVFYRRPPEGAEDGNV